MWRTIGQIFKPTMRPYTLVPLQLSRFVDKGKRLFGGVYEKGRRKITDWRGTKGDLRGGCGR